MKSQSSGRDRHVTPFWLPTTEHQQYWLRAKDGPMHTEAVTSKFVRQRKHTKPQYCFRDINYASGKPKTKNYKQPTTCDSPYPFVVVVICGKAVIFSCRFWGRRWCVLADGCQNACSFVADVSLFMKQRLCSEAGGHGPCSLNGEGNQKQIKSPLELLVLRATTKVSAKDVFNWYFDA